MKISVSRPLNSELLALKPIDRLRVTWDYMSAAIIQLALLVIFFGAAWHFIPSATEVGVVKALATPLTRRAVPSIYHYAESLPGGMPLFSAVMLGAGLLILGSFLVKTRSAYVVLIGVSAILFLQCLVMLDGSIRVLHLTGGVGYTITGFWAMISARFFHTTQALVRRWGYVTAT